MSTFRELKKEDEERLIEIFKQPSALFDFKKFNAENLIEDERCHCIVLEKEGVIIGFASIIFYQVPTKGWVGRIEDVIVDEEMRGMGFGRGLMEKLLEIAKEKNIKVVELTSNPAREKARRLYESLGFELRDTGVFRLNL